MAKLGPPFGRIPWNKGLKVGDRIRKNKLYAARNCVYCDAEFFCYPSQNKRYCSHKCRALKTKPWEKLRGRKLSTHHKENLSKAHIGVQSKDKHPLWKGGLYKTARVEDMANNNYKKWRIAVFNRDNFTCVGCGHDKYVQAHHIKPYASHPTLRYTVENGQTLCKQCHYMLHLVAGNKNTARVEIWH